MDSKNCYLPARGGRKGRKGRNFAPRFSVIISILWKDRREAANRRSSVAPGDLLDEAPEGIKSPNFAGCCPTNSATSYGVPALRSKQPLKFRGGSTWAGHWCESEGMLPDTHFSEMGGPNLDRIKPELTGKMNWFSS